MLVLDDENNIGGANASVLEKSAARTTKNRIAGDIAFRLAFFKVKRNEFGLCS